MKKLLLFGLSLFSAIMYGQTSELYSYVCDYNVNTGTGEKKKWHTTLRFFCKFNEDKTICYEANSEGKLAREIYPSDEEKPMKEGRGNYQKRGCEEYHYVKTENNVLVYKKTCRYYKYSYFKTDSWGKYIAPLQRVYEQPDEYTSYIYFSPDYSKMNQPGGYENCVFSYDRIYPDKKGAPTQIW